MNGDEPLNEAILGSRRRLAFALSEGSHDGHHHVRGYSLRRIEILDEGSYTCLVKFSLHRGDMYQAPQRALVQAVLEGMAADDMDSARKVDSSLLGLGVRCFPLVSVSVRRTGPCEPLSKASSASCRLAGRSSADALAVGG